MSITYCKQQYHGDTDMITKHDGENVRCESTQKIFIEGNRNQRLEAWGKSFK